MLLLLAMAQLYGVAQLALLGWIARVVRLRVLLLALLAGAYAAAPAALLLEVAWTRLVAAGSGDPLAEVTARAAWTVDPLIEECVKLAPLVLLWLLVRAVRRQWGATDAVLAGAALGAGFGLTEGLLRLADHAGQAVHLAGGGWAVPAGQATARVPGIAGTLGAWLPAGIAGGGLPDTGGAGTSLDLHLMWSSVAALGIVLALRRGPSARIRVAGLVLVALVVLDHAAANAQGVAGQLAHTLATPFTSARVVDWAFPLAALAAAIWLDRRPVQAEPGAEPPEAEATLACERRRGPRWVGLGRLAAGRLPWSPPAVWGFVRLRRAWRRSARWGEPDLALGEALGLLGPALDRAGSWRGSRVWHGATLRLARRRAAARAQLPAAGELLTTAEGLLALAWLLLLLVPLLYLLVGGWPSLAGVQRAMRERPLNWVVAGAALVGAAWIAWNLAAGARRLPEARRHPAAEVPASAILLLLIRAGALLATLAAAWLLALGHPPAGLLVAGAHLLEAGGQASLLLVLVLALTAIASDPPFADVPPATRGELLLGRLVVSAVVGGVGVALLDDDGDGPRRPDGGEPVPGLHYTAAELARLADRHAGPAERPSVEEIERAIVEGRAQPVRGHNAVRFDDRGVRVIVNRDLPWRSTAYFTGR
jgi:RsiW-degrading membrane proteinase PrsW (M82 family)